MQGNAIHIDVCGEVSSTAVAVASSTAALLAVATATIATGYISMT